MKVMSPKCTKVLAKYIYLICGKRRYDRSLNQHRETLLLYGYLFLVYQIEYSTVFSGFNKAYLVSYFKPER